MKMNIEVEINWLDEDQNIDDAVQSSIVDAVTGKIGKDIIKQLSKEALNTINYGIDKYIDDLLRGFLDREFVVTDRYGDVTARYTNVEEMLKEKFDSFMSQSVDSKGKPTTGCNYKENDRLSFLISNIVNKQKDAFNKQIEKAADGVVTNLKQFLTEKTNQEVQKAVAEKIFDKIKL